MAIRAGNGAEVGDWVRRWSTGWGLEQLRAGRLATAIRQLGQACLADKKLDTVVLLLWQDGNALTGQLSAADPVFLGRDAFDPVAGPPDDLRTDLRHQRERPDANCLVSPALAQLDLCCDLVQCRSGPSGTVVRFAIRL